MALNEEPLQACGSLIREAAYEPKLQYQSGKALGLVLRVNSRTIIVAPPDVRAASIATATLRQRPLDGHWWWTTQPSSNTDRRHCCAQTELSQTVGGQSLS